MKMAKDMYDVLGEWRDSLIMRVRKYQREQDEFDALKAQEGVND